MFSFDAKYIVPVNYNKTYLMLLLAAFWMFNSYAQTKGNKRVNDVFGNWSFGAGINTVDDSGTKGKDLFNFNENWNTTFPLTVNVDYYIDNQWSISLTGSTNKYVSGKNIDSTGIVIEGYAADYLAIDLAAKLHLGDIFTSYAFDPYLFLGFGYNIIGAYRLEPFIVDVPVDIDNIPNDAIVYNIPEIAKITLNGGVGFNYWFAKTWGLNFNFTGKVGISSGEFKKGPNSVSDHAQLTLGLIYFFKNK